MESKMVKNNHSKQFWGVFLVLAILLVVQINVVSAMDWDNIKEFKDSGKYGTIEIYNSFLIPGIVKGSKLSEYTLLENTDQCDVDCYSVGSATLYKDDVLFDDYDFVDNRGNKKLLDYNIYLEVENRESVTIIDYEWQCINSIELDTCIETEVGQHEEEKITYTWEEYYGTELEAGDYRWRLEGKKENNVNIDWSVGMAGISTDEVRKHWAWWNDACIAEGGTSYLDGNYCVHTFRESGTFNITESLNATVLIVAGGGGGGSGTVGNDGGGGAGGLYYNTSYEITSNKSVTVGLGGVINTDADGGQGGSSGIGTTNVIGGGFGSVYNNRAGGPGGSGGGAGQGNATGGTPSAGQGYVGGSINPASNSASGGGGSSQMGGNATADGTYGGFGGNGTEYSINGTAVYYAGGGGGGTHGAGGTNYSLGGLGGGGDGKAGDESVLAQPGTNGTGGGGGGGGESTVGAIGGTGIVIVRYDAITSGLTTTISSPVDYYNSIDNTIDLSCNFSSVFNTNISNVTIEVFDSSTNLDYTNTNTTPAGVIQSFNKTWTTTLTDDSYNWSCYAYGDGSEYDSTSNRTFTIDSTTPSTNLTSPSGVIGYHKLGNNLSINWTVSDTNIDSCWFGYNNTNTTVTCTANNYSFTTVSGKQNLTFYANDTVGNSESNFTSWTYLLLFTNQTYVASTTAGSSTTFTSNFTTNGTRIETIYLDYNNTKSLATLSSSGNNYAATISQLAPGVSTVTNISFFWNVTMDGSSSYSTNPSNQTVSSIGINDTCGAGSNVIYNLTIVDEITQQEIDGAGLNGSITVDFNLYTTDRTSNLKQYSTQKTNINNLAICIDNDLSGGEQYSMDLQVQYGATTNYSSEFYNLERETLNSSTLSQNITLYDLHDDNAQEFKLNVRDRSYVPISGALVVVERKYIENGTFKTVEIPKTDSLGIATASLQVDNVIYNFNIYLNGILTSTFTNVYAVCQNPSLRECEIDFNAFLSGITIPDYSTADDFNFTLGYNKTSKVVTSQFQIPSGLASTIKLEVIREDTLGTAVCSDSLTSTSGTLSCTVPSNFGNATVRARLLRDGTMISYGTFKLDQTPSEIFGVIQIFISVLVMMTLIGIGVSDSPVITGVFLFIGLILLFSMNLVENTGFYGASASILFFAIALVIVIIKAARRS